MYHYHSHHYLIAKSSLILPACQISNHIQHISLHPYILINLSSYLNITSLISLLIPKNHITHFTPHISTSDHSLHSSYLKITLFSLLIYLTITLHSHHTSASYNTHLFISQYHITLISSLHIPHLLT